MSFEDLQRVLLMLQVAREVHEQPNLKSIGDWCALELNAVAEEAAKAMAESRRVAEEQETETRGERK